MTPEEIATLLIEIQTAANKGNFDDIYDKMELLPDDKRIEAIEANDFNIIKKATKQSKFGDINDWIELTALAGESLKNVIKATEYKLIRDAAEQSDYELIALWLKCLPKNDRKQEQGKIFKILLETPRKLKDTQVILNTGLLILKLEENNQPALVDNLLIYLGEDKTKELIQANDFAIIRLNAKHNAFDRINTLLGHLPPEKHLAAFKSQNYGVIQWAASHGNFLKVNEILSTLSKDDQINAIKTDNYNVIIHAKNYDNSRQVDKFLAYLSDKDQQEFKKIIEANSKPDHNNLGTTPEVQNMMFLLRQPEIQKAVMLGLCVGITVTLICLTFGGLSLVAAAAVGVSAGFVAGGIGLFSMEGSSDEDESLLPGNSGSKFKAL
ncbi:MAG: hypothetical protein QNK11_04535 [Legionella sp.]|nr:hypothetical protein [Legionella sp.]